MFCTNIIRILRSSLAGCLILGTCGTAAARKLRTISETDVVRTCDTSSVWTDNATAGFIRTGEMVAERDIALFTADLLNTYKILQNDKRNLTRLFLRCDRNWGATAYALALQAASRMPLDVVLMNYDAAGRDWERTAFRLRMVYRNNLQPVYTFGIYLNRQEEVWREALEAPRNWRRTFLSH